MLDARETWTTSRGKRMSAGAVRAQRYVPFERRLPMEGSNAVVKLVGSRTECTGTGLFSFTHPKGYRFAAGQFRYLTLATREGEQTKAFTHCDVPGEPVSLLLTRMTGSPFKDALAALRPGDEVEMSGPRGRLTLPEGTMRAGFLVGGVGITPAASIVGDSVARRTGLDCLVLYGNTDQSCIPLHGRFAEYAAAGAPVRVVDVLSKPLPGWTGESGYISAEILRRHVDPSEPRHWFVSGPPLMVAAMLVVLTECGVPDGRVSSELFSGYR
jgi:ferredoxin-NADP reductase